MIAITGASGLLGKYIIDELIKTTPPEEIIAIYHNNVPNDIVDGINYIKIDLLEIVALEELFEKHSIKIIIHAAAFVSFEPNDEQLLKKVNKDITANLVNISLYKNVKRFIHISSIATLDRDQPIEGIMINEQHYLSNYKDKSNYAISKHLAEMEVWRGYAEGLPVTIFNPGIILGYHASHNSSAALFHKVKKGLKFYTRGTTSFVLAQDIAKAISISMYDDKAIGERFILSNGNYTYEYILKKIAESLSVNPPKIYAKKWQSELLWRLGRIQSFFIRKKPLITKETARTAHANYLFDNSKFNNFYPTFEYSDIDKSIITIGLCYNEK